MLIISLIYFVLSYAGAGQSLNIVYTNDFEGNIATCGCATDPGGGVVRLINWYRGANLSPTDTVYINSGSTLFSGTVYADYEVAAAKNAAEIMSDALLAMNIDAFTPGEYDTKMGVVPFTATAKKLPVLLSNSKNKNFPKEIKIDRAGYNVVILGVSSNKDIASKNFTDVVKSAVKKNRKKNTAIILLADMDEKNLNKILKQVKGIDVVLSSSPDEQLTQPKIINNSVVIRILKGGDSVGLLKYDPSSKKERYDNQIFYLGKMYDKENEFSPRLKKYEELQKSAAPRYKDQ
ncbi:MAG: hypothetical protein V1647_04970 [Pseudomonadota bacterium]